MWPFTGDPAVVILRVGTISLVAVLGLAGLVRFVLF